MKMIKRCVIIHGCTDDSEDNTYNKHWIPWVKSQLESEGIEVNVPLMPEPWKPDYEVWKAELDKIQIDENTVFVGHSCGCAFLVRWLGETKSKVAKLILVAPWKIPDETSEIKKKFYNYEINSATKDLVSEVVYFTANDEEDEGKESLEIFHNSLGGKIIELKDHGHYILGDMEKEEFPELVETILE